MGRLDVDRYLAWRFDRTRRHCWTLTRAAWLELTGIDIGERVAGEIAFSALAVRFGQGTSGFERLAGPADPSLVMMSRPGTVPHCGVFYRGRILQMTRRGPSYLPLAVAGAGYKEIEFFR